AEERIDGGRGVPLEAEDLPGADAEQDTGSAFTRRDSFARRSVDDIAAGVFHDEPRVIGADAETVGERGGGLVDQVRIENPDVGPEVTEGVKESSLVDFRIEAAVRGIGDGEGEDGSCDDVLPIGVLGK